MSLTKDGSGKYSRVDDESSFENEAAFFIPLSEQVRKTRTRSGYSFISKLLLWGGQFLLLTANLYGLSMWAHSMKTADRFDNPLSVPIHYITRKMFDEKSNHTAFEGPSTPEIDGKWNELLDVGIIKLDSTANAKLHSPTTRLYGGEDGWAGFMEVFHQLHCLNRVRKIFYGHTREELHETEGMFKFHTEHCFDYIRQSLMCHADVGIMSMNWEDEPPNPGYAANFSIIKQCRDFDSIHQWAREHKPILKPPTSDEEHGLR